MDEGMEMKLRLDERVLAIAQGPLPSDQLLPCLTSYGFNNLHKECHPLWHLSIQM